MTPGEQIARLESEIRRHNRLYWDQARPEIDDYAYDRLVEQLRRLAPESPVLTELGPSRRLGAGHRHAVPMLSLDKCYSDEDFARWLASFEGAVVAMPKFDGIACSLTYDADGRLRVAATRGDGVAGDDITYNATAIADVPTRLARVSRELEVRGEIYMRLSVFERYRAEGMMNPRNLTAGAIKLKDRKRSAAYELSFAAYDLIGSEHETLSGALGQLVDLGFPRVDWQLLEHAEASTGYARFAALRPQLDYEIDGVVFKVDRFAEQRRLGSTSHHPRYAIAYKFQGESGVSTLERVEWSVARSGAITPVAHIAPVALSGVTVSRASLHNVAFIDRLGLTLGARVTVVRRGGVIPNVEHVVEAGHGVVEIPAACPSCGSPVQRERDFLYCTAPGTCKGVILGQLAHYAAVTDLLGFGESLLDHAYSAGLLRDPADFYALEAPALEGLERSGKKLAQKLIGEIAKTRTLELATFLRALGITDLGKSVAQLLAERYRELPAVLAATEEELAATHGIGEVIARNVVQGLRDKRPLIDRLLAHVTLLAPPAPVAGGALAGKSFVFTGKLVAFSRDEAETLARSLGGAVHSGVTRTLDYLVVGAGKGAPSTKQKAADKLIAAGAALRILTEDEFLALARAQSGDPT